MTIQIDYPVDGNFDILPGMADRDDRVLIQLAPSHARDWIAYKKGIFVRESR